MNRKGRCERDAAKGTLGRDAGKGRWEHKGGMLGMLGWVA